MSIELTENGMEFGDGSPYQLEIVVSRSGYAGSRLAYAYCRKLFGDEPFATYSPTNNYTKWEVWRCENCYRLVDELQCLNKCLEFIRNQMIKNGVSVPEVRFMDNLLPDELPISGGKIAKMTNAIVGKFNGGLDADSVLESIREEIATDRENAFDPVSKPQHYNQCRVECIDILEDLGLLEDYARGNAIKYLWRMGDKGNAAQDARKAAWYANRLAECLEKKESE